MQKIKSLDSKISEMKAIALKKEKDVKKQKKLVDVWKFKEKAKSRSKSPLISR